MSTYFIDNLPTVPGVYAQEFASGMAQYWLAYKERRDSSMNYEKKQDYLSERCYIMAVPADQFWHHSPAFKKTIAQTIQDLFKTEIVGLGGNYVKPEPLFLMVDSAGNRWPIKVEDSKLYAPQDSLCSVHYVDHQADGRLRRPHVRRSRGRMENHASSLNGRIKRWIAPSALCTTK